MPKLTGYVRHVWECGETITDEKMNNIEQGITQAIEGGGVIVIKAASITAEDPSITITTDKTWQEVADAIADGTPCYVGFSVGEICTVSDASSLNKLVMIPAISAASNEDGYLVGFLGYPNGGETLGIDFLFAEGNEATGLLQYTAECQVS